MKLVINGPDRSQKIVENAPHIPRAGDAVVWGEGVVTFVQVVLWVFPELGGTEVKAVINLTHSAP